MKEMILSSVSPEQTRALAAYCAGLLRGGEIIFLRGPIGAGKTVFVKGLARAWGVKGSPTSASFSLMKHYSGAGRSLYHIDLFRLSEGEVFNLGFEEMLEDEQAVILAEWPDPLCRVLPQDRLEMDFVLKSGDEREIRLRAGGAVSQKLAEELCKRAQK